VFFPGKQENSNREGFPAYCGRPAVSSENGAIVKMLNNLRNNLREDPRLHGSCLVDAVP